MFKLSILVTSILFVGLLYFTKDEVKAPAINENKSFRGDSQFAIDNCYNLSNDESNIYKTAAGFDLHIPKWVKTIHHVFQFNIDCELSNIQFYFLIKDGVVLPKAHSESGHINYELGFSVADRLTVMASFKKLVTDSKRLNNPCVNKQGVIQYPEHNLFICPYLKAEKNKHLKNLPYFPIFQFKKEGEHLATLTCSHSQLKGYGLDNILELDIKYPCRGHWKWRAGAYIMFDISKGKILTKTYDSIIQTEEIINSWVVEKPNKKLNKDKKQLAFTPSSFILANNFLPVN